MPIQAFPINCEGGLVLDKSVFVAKPGEAVTLVLISMMTIRLQELVAYWGWQYGMKK